MIQTRGGMSHKVWAAACRNTFLLLYRNNSAPNSHLIKLAIPMLSRFCFCFMYIACCTCSRAFPLYWCLLQVCSLLWPPWVPHDPKVPTLAVSCSVVTKGLLLQHLKCSTYRFWVVQPDPTETFPHCSCSKPEMDSSLLESMRTPPPCSTWRMPAWSARAVF